MKPGVRLLCATALLAWAGLFAWGWMTQRASAPAAEEGRPREAAELAALTDQVSALQEDVQALAATLAQNLETLQANLELGQEQRGAELEHALAALREELRARAVRGEAAEPEIATPAEPAPGPQLEPDPTARGPAAASAGSVPAAESAPPAGKKSFLAFRLPSDEFRLDERRVWSVLPALSRVGFDGKSTLHAFSGATSQIAGEVEVDPSRPGDAPRARIRVQAATLDTGNADRDEDLREHLATDAHPELAFELEGFEPGEVDLPAKRVTGTAQGKLTIHGTEHVVSMPVRLTLDEANRLCIEGEMPLKLSDYGVSVPSKLGVISMKDDVKVWISLKLRASAKR